MIEPAKDWAFRNLKGLWACPQAPFNRDFSLDEEGLYANYRQCLKLDVGGVGYTMLMEPWSSTHDERMRGVEIMVDAVGDAVPKYANVTDHSTAEIIRLAEHALAAGVDLVMVNCPFEWAKSEELAFRFFEYITERIPGKVLIYNTAHSGLILSPATISRLADIANVCGLKNAINDLEHSAEVHRLAGDRMVVCDPFEVNLLGAIERYGQQALISTTAVHLMQSPLWQPIRDYMLKAIDGDFASAKSIRDEVEPLRQQWLELYEKVTNLAHANHPLAATKYWQGLMGMRGGPVRPPSPQVTEEQKQKVTQGLQAFADRLGIEWPPRPSGE